MTYSLTNRAKLEEVAFWLESNMSASAFAAQRGYSAAALRRWAKDQEKPYPKGPPCRFVRLDIVGRQAAELKVQVGSACVVVSHGFDPELLRQVVDALAGGRES
jgi:hypothetical protein